MAEYIEKGAIYNKIAELEELARNRYLDTPSNSPVFARYMAQMQERTALKFLIADFPAADAVPVLRCKDCKHFCPCEEVDGETWLGWCAYGEFNTDDLDFCSRGERKDNGEA